MSEATAKSLGMIGVKSVVKPIILAPGNKYKMVRTNAA